MRVVARSWSRRSSLSGTADRLPDFTKVKQVTPDQFLASRTNDPDRGWTGTPLVTTVPPESKSRGIFWSGDASETAVTPRTVSGSPCRGTCGPPRSRGAIRDDRYCLHTAPGRRNHRDI